jgi:topoisomerase IV subunit A
MSGVNDKPAPDPGRIVAEPVNEALSSRYLAYALSTITSRALPDVRDGLKPVQRRILYAMRELKLNPDQGFKKCARVVGDVIGRFHPHGDTAVYDALVRLAQSFSQRYPLVDGQGNFGNVDGDGAAAMRYTEAKLTEAARALLDGLDAGAVDFRGTYSGEDEEPVVLPAAFPNLLANGTNGIAVGMATSIPPHNAHELILACQALLDTPELDDDALLTLVPGPDLPTGGILVEPSEAIKEAYRTGRGSMRLRSRWHTEDLGRGQWQVVITEVPYQVQKSRLIERIAELIELKKVPLLGDVMDESAEDVRIVLEPKSRNTDPALLMETLFRQCDLEVRLSLNMNVLDGGTTPRVMGLREVLWAFLNHRRDVLQRRSRFRLEKIDRRLEVLAGYIIAFLNLDRVIEIIRENDEPKPLLVTEFSLTETQAEAILNMRLRSLRKLEEMELRNEHAALEAERSGLDALLGSQDKQWTAIRAELGHTAKLFGPDTALGARRTSFAESGSAPEISAAALIPREPITFVLSRKGWVRALKGHRDTVDDVTFKEDDGPAFTLKCETVDRLIVLANDGKAYTLGADKLPGGRGAGEPLRLLVDLSDGATPLAVVRYDDQARYLIASDAGNGFIVALAAVIAQTRSGKQVLNLGPGEEAAIFVPALGDLVATIGENRKLLVFGLNELPEMARGKGVRLQTLKNSRLADVRCFEGTAGLSWQDSAGRQRLMEEWRDFIGKRAQAGKVVPKGFARSGRFSPPLL